MTAMAFGWPSAVSRVPSSGSTATSTWGPSPLPISSPLKSIGASSFSPSPITTTPSIETVSSIVRIASTAAWSALSFSPRPIQRAAPSAAASVTRTSSSARLRSGRISTKRTPHPFGRVDSDEIETPGNDALRRTDQPQPECLGLRPDDAVLVVEAVEVVCDPDGVDRDGVWCAALRGLGSHRRKLQEPLDESALLLRELARRVAAFALGVAEHRSRSLQPADVAVMVGAENVDRTIEAAFELVPDVGDVGGVVEVRTVLGTDQRTILVIAVSARPRPDRPFRLVGVQLRQDA